MLSIGVLIHLDGEGVKKALGEFHRVLRRRGILFISVKEGSVKYVENFKWRREVYLHSEDFIDELLKKLKFEILDFWRTKHRVDNVN